MESLINKTLEDLCKELVLLKREYFSPQGKPNSGWKPLTQDTLRIKKKKSPATYNSFNLQTGKLRDSIEVSFERTATGARLTCRSTDDNTLVRYLTKTLGRDFIEFGDLERNFIINKFKELLIGNVNKN